MNKILHPEIDPTVEEEFKVEIKTIIEIIIGPTTEIDPRGRWNNHRSGDRSNNYQNSNQRGYVRPNYRQNVQWTSRNRSHSRNRAENYNYDHMRGRSRDRHDNRPVQSRQSTLSHGRDKSRSRSNSRVSTDHDHVRCFRCREYDHFASECPNIPTDKEPDYTAQ